MAPADETANISSPMAWRRWLSAELVRLRKAARLKQRDTANALDCSIGKVSYLEGGDRPVDGDELTVLLRLYQVDRDRWPRYIEAARSASREGWWDSWSDDDMAGYVRRYIGLEDGAQRVRAFDPIVVHGLLQTADYARAIIKATTSLPAQERIARRAELRVHRQAVLTRDSPLQLHVVLDEATLHRQVGGPTVLVEQLRHLADVAESLDSVTVQVIPFEAGAHAGSYGPFAILDFALEGDLGLVFVEDYNESHFIEEAKEIYRRSQAFDQLARTASDPLQSIKLIRSLAQRSAR